MFRGVILGALAFGAIFAAERQFGLIEKDLKRYDAMRTMSGDAPFLRSVLDGALGMLAQFGANRSGEAQTLATSLTHDIMRYAAMRSM